jgi:hypothetical protein
VAEAEWLAGTDPQRMLEFLRGRAGERKLRRWSRRRLSRRPGRPAATGFRFSTGMTALRLPDERPAGIGGRRRHRHGQGPEEAGSGVAVVELRDIAPRPGGTYLAAAFDLDRTAGSPGQRDQFQGVALPPLANSSPLR